MIVVDPDGAFEAALWKRCVEGLEMAFVIAIEPWTGGGQDAEIVETVVIEVAGGDGDCAGEFVRRPGMLFHEFRNRCDTDGR